MEYFIDTDPGIGNGFAVPVTFATNITESFTVNTSALSTGFHTIYFRVEDDNNVWSISESRSFYISPSNLTVRTDLSAMEYFFDTDPGIGSGTSIPITPSTDILVNQNLATATLPSGFHVLYVRSRDADGIWGNVESRAFYVSQADLTMEANIVAMEYYFDTDPGYGTGIAIPVTPGTTINEAVTLSTAALNAGHHTLHVRALDSDGIWGEVESRTFFIDAFAAGQLVGIEYFFNSDPGIGGATQLNFANPVGQLDSTVNLSTASLSTGPQVVGIRLIGENSTYSITEFATINLCDGALASIIADTVCVGTSTSFLDQSINVLGTDLYGWDFDADGAIDDNTPGDKTFTYAAAGTYEAVLSIDRLGCVSTDTISIVVEDIPIANAGPDQDICNTTAALNALPVQVMQTGSWSILSGDGVFDDPNQPNANISGITVNNVELIWTVTSASGSCLSTDTVVITTNQPIAISRQTSTVDIGQSVVTDLSSAASINGGDLLTTTILEEPMYGVATILTDGSIEYTPDLDAPELDSLLFRLTNQCNNTAENYLTYSILNTPPVVVNQVANVTFDRQVATFDLTTLISDPNNNLDLTTIEIIGALASGAEARIENGILIIDYTNITFRGTEVITIRVCDLTGVCTTQQIEIPDIDVRGELPKITVFNGVSPDGDGFNDFLEIENIEFYPDNTVIIMNRWGTKIEELRGYNNSSVVFNDPNLPSGTYYFHILPGIEGADPVSGHFLLKNDN